MIQKVIICDDEHCILCLTFLIYKLSKLLFPSICVGCTGGFMATMLVLVFIGNKPVALSSVCLGVSIWTKTRNTAERKLATEFTRHNYVLVQHKHFILYLRR